MIIFLPLVLLAILPTNIEGRGGVILSLSKLPDGKTTAEISKGTAQVAKAIAQTTKSSTHEPKPKPSPAKHDADKKPAEKINIHTWKHTKPGYKLECDTLPGRPGKFSVKVYYEEALLETAVAVTLDGQLTTSVQVKSCNTSVHVIRYLKTDRTCVTRFYIESSEGKKFDIKEEECPFPASILDLPRTKLRKNGWIWGEFMMENWGLNVRGFWRGAVEGMPNIADKQDVEKPSGGIELHTWHNVVKGFRMTVYRVMEEKEEQHYMSIHQDGHLLQGQVKITRFDDDLLNSVSVLNPTGEQQDTFHIEYKLTTGSCLDRQYRYVLDSVESKPHLGVTEDQCSFFTFKKFFNYVANIDAINGWRYGTMAD